MFRKLLILSSCAVFLVGCGSDETPENIIDTVEGTNTTTGTTDGSNDGGTTTSSNNFTAPSGSMQQIFDDFISCKDNATESFACKEYPAKALCSVYGINDFMTGDDSYIKYDELLESLDMGKWEKVGPASDQSALDKAQAAANAGRAAFAIDEGDKYGNIAIILAGESQRSTKWGLNCPNSASLFMKGHKYSYIEKGLNYAWKDNSDVYVYVRKN